jgi:hypothetical protein
MALDGSYCVVQAAKIVAHAGKSDQMLVKGLQSITLPIGATGSTTSLSVIGTRIAVKVATGLEYEDMTSNYYFAKGDPSQAYLMRCSREGTQIQDMRFYMDATDFAALDLINDAGGYLGVGTFSSPTGQKNEVLSGSVTFVPSGSFILFDRHAVGTALSFTAGGVGVSAQVTRSDTGTGGSFVADGFEVGDTVIIDKLASLDPIYAKVKTVIAGTMTFEDAIGGEGTISSTAGGATTAIHGATPVEVIDTF